MGRRRLPISGNSGALRLPSDTRPKTIRARILNSRGVDRGSHSIGERRCALPRSIWAGHSPKSAPVYQFSAKRCEVNLSGTDVPIRASTG